MKQTHFVYMWFDKTRKMFYVGMHSGSLNDEYITSSRWLLGEIKYRPNEFKRRIIKVHKTKTEAKKHEGHLLTLIEEAEFGTKYYNYKHGAPKGNIPWNLGKKGIYSEETKRKMSEARMGTSRPYRKNPKAAENGKKGSVKLSLKVTGRKRLYNPDGSWTWTYPDNSAG